MADRIRRHIAALTVDVITHHGPATVTGLTVSIGAVHLPGDGHDLDTLLHLADAQLYTAKNAGRDLVRIADTGPEPAHDAPGSPPVGLSGWATGPIRSCHSIAEDGDQTWRLGAHLTRVRE